MGRVEGFPLAADDGTHCEGIRLLVVGDVRRGLLALDGAQHLILVVDDEGVDVREHDFVLGTLEAGFDNLINFRRPCVDFIGAYIRKLVGFGTLGHCLL